MLWYIHSFPPVVKTSTVLLTVGFAIVIVYFRGSYGATTPYVSSLVQDRKTKMLFTFRVMVEFWG